MENINEIISKNLIQLRKNNNLTQAQLAEKFNYSDKTISKWESGESMPSIEILHNLAQFYSVTLNDLTTENKITTEIIKPQINHTSFNKVVITLLATLVVWLVATLIFVYAQIIFNESVWQVFVWSMPISLIVLLVFNSIWGKKKVNYLIISFLVWTLISSIYLQFIQYNFWVIFILGIPLQISIILWSGLKVSKK